MKWHVYGILYLLYLVMSSTEKSFENYFATTFSAGREYAAHRHDFCYRLIRGNYIVTNITVVECERLLESKRTTYFPQSEAKNDKFSDEYVKIMKSSPPSPYTARVLGKSGLECIEYRLDIARYYGDTFCNVMLDSNSGKVLAQVSRRDPTPEMGTPRVLCAIITYEPRHHSAYAVASTWGAECTGFLAYSNLANYSIPTITIDFNTTETIENYWFKKKAVYRHIHQHYMAEFDWFMFGDDDTYVIAPNLYHFIQFDATIKWLLQKNRGVYAGRPMRLESYPGENGELFERYNTFYNSGCGYLLDTVALVELVEELRVSDCGQGLSDNNADVYVAQCLRARNIHPFITKDERGADKFHHYHPDMIYTYDGAVDSEVGNFYYFHSYKFVAGIAGCSPDSIVFHYVKHPIYMQQIDAFFHMCKISSE